MKKRGHSRRLLSVLLALVMLLSLLPTAVFADTTPKATLITDASTLKAGDQIILAASANGKTYAAGSLSGKLLTSIETNPTDPADTVEIFTLGGEAGKWTLTASDGKQIYTADAKALNNTGKGTGTWTIAIDDSGLATVASTDSACGRILYNVKSPRFLNYTSATNVSMLLPSIYRLEVSPARQSGIVTDLTTLRDGDKVVVFNPANGKTLSTEYTGHYNKGTDVTLADGKLEGFTDADKWTLGINDDGTYTFATADGKKLAMGTDFTSTPLDEIVMEYITTVLGGVVGQEYAEPDGRMTVILPPDEDDGKITIGGLDANIWMTKYGNVYTDCKAEKFMGDMGFNWGDLVTVEFLGKTLTLPVIPTYSYVDSGKPAIIVEKGEDGNPTGYVSMAINMGNFAETYELAVKHTDEDKNWYWTAWEGVTYPVEVTFTMAEKDGYRAEYILHELQRTNDRADYPDLTDEEFANFRNVATTGMGKNLLYRGSSPINPELGRSGYADAALKKAGVTVIMNLADSEADAKAYEGFADTYYAGQKVIYLNLGVDFTAPEFQAGLADGLRFFAANKGVYYVHCTEGKDRAGFVNALLECLMGATFNEVVEDYMTTYYNYYGVEPGTDKYTAIAESNIIKTLQTAFGVEDLSKADLQKGAKDYMKAIGLTDAEITSLMTNLGYKAPTTGDTGVVLYVGLAVLALTGGVFVARRKELF